MPSPITACGGSSAGGSVATTHGHPDPEQFAATIGCTNYQADPQTTMFAATTGSCDYGSGSVQIDTFASAKAEESYQKVADSQGRTGTMLYGSRWVVSGDNADQTAEIQQKAGGDVH